MLRPELHAFVMGTQPPSNHGIEPTEFSRGETLFSRGVTLRSHLEKLVGSLLRNPCPLSTRATDWTKPISTGRLFLAVGPCEASL